MNVPVYAAALVAFAVSFLQFHVFLGYSFLIALAAMALVLSIQLAAGSRRRRTASPPPDGAEVTRDRWRWAIRAEAPEEVISLIFIVVTWGIFTFLGSDLQFVGPGFTTPSSTASTAETLGVVGALALLGLLVGYLLYRYARQRALARVDRLLALLRTAVAPPEGDSPLHNGSSTAEGPVCEAAGAAEFAFAGLVPRHFRSAAHSPPLASVMLTGAGKLRQARFTLCAAHLEIIVRAELSGPFGGRVAVGSPG